MFQGQNIVLLQAVKNKIVINCGCILVSEKNEGTETHYLIDTCLFFIVVNHLHVECICIKSLLLII